MITPIKRLSLGLIALVLALGVAWLLGQALLAGSSDLSQISHRLEALKPALTLWRMGLIALVVIGWPSLCRWLVQRSQKPFSESELKVLIQLRWKLLLVLGLVELLLVQRLVF